MRNRLPRTKCLLVLTLLICVCGHAQNILVSPIHTFDSHNAGSGLIPTQPVSLSIGRFDGSLYGVTFQDQTNGSIFSLKADGSGYAVLHAFAPGEESAAGYAPGVGYTTPSVLQGADGMLYGTTPKGGTNNYGTYFKLSPNGTGYTILHNFDSDDSSPANLIQGSDNMFYGAGNRIFKIDANGGNYTILYTFTNGADGFDPMGLTQGRDGVLYGITYLGGTNGNGTVFSMDTNGTSFKVLHSFASTGGENPASPLLQGSDGALYGVTSDYVIGTPGTIFKINTNGDGFTVLHTFTGAPNDGSIPLGSLVEGVGQVLYGTAYSGGKTYGTIFKIGMDGSGYASVYFFTNGTSIGVKPITGLVKSQDNPSVFYGTTSGNTSPVTGSVFVALVGPPISITPVVSQTASNQTVLFWPAWAGTYTLQSTTNVASGNWVNVSNGTPVFGVQVTSTNPAVFYRLVSP